MCKICDEASPSFSMMNFRHSLFGTSRFCWLPDFGHVALAPYGLPGLTGYTKLLTSPSPPIYVRTAMTQVLEYFRPYLTFSLLISLINDEGSTGPPVACQIKVTMAYGRPCPGIEYIKNLRWRKSYIFCELRLNIRIFHSGVNSAGPLWPGEQATTACRSTHSRI